MKTSLQYITAPKLIYRFFIKSTEVTKPNLKQVCQDKCIRSDVRFK